MRQVHFRNGCKTSSKHIGGYIELTFAQFQAAPATKQCARCLAGKAFALNLRRAAA